MRRTTTIAIVLALAALVVAPTLTSMPAGATPGPVASPLVSIDAGEGFRCAVTAAGGVQCWGSDSRGRLGRGSEQPDALVPGAVSGLPAGAVAVATAGAHACALIGAGAGDVWCWGDRVQGQTGGTVETSPQYVPAQVSSLPDVVAITAGFEHSCAVTELGAVWCWGSNDNRVLGSGGSGGQSAPVVVPGLPRIVQVAAGYDLTCALAVDGGVWCWGANGYGQLGFGTVGTTDVAPGQVVGIGAAARSITVGAQHACAVTVAGGLRCWGVNLDRQLGNGTTTSSVAPVTPTGLGSGVASASAGTIHTCAVTAAGGARCWGENYDGDVGIANRAPAPAPATVSGLASGVRAIAAGDYGTCALLTSGSARCWGQALSGELGDGTRARRPTPGAGAATGVARVAAGDAASCATRTAGGVRCWGSNLNGQLGDGSDDRAASTTSVGATGVSDSIDIDLGEDHACEVEADGQVRCWGSNLESALGTGGSSSTSPVLVTGVGGDATSIATGVRHSCAARPTGVRCWGNNIVGQLGDGTTTTRATPTTVTNLNEDVVEVAAGSFHTCARIVDGSLRCWGRNIGALGDGSVASQSLTPVSPVGISSGATSVAGGLQHTCAAVNGAVRCWGTNALGQIGHPSSAGIQASPYAVPSLTSGWVEVAAGGSTSCARSSAGRVVCWGENSFQQLGDGSTVATSATPVQAIASGAVDIDLSKDGTTACAALGDGSVRCWGRNDNAQAGSDPGWTPRTVTGGAIWASGQPWAPFASWTALADQQYLDLLARTPTSAERSTVVAALTNGTGTPGDLVAALRNDVDQTGAVDPTTRLYFAYFLRIPDKSGLEFWIRRKRSGYLLRTISDSFATSSEFVRRYGTLTNRQFVELIYQNLFARTGDAAGVDYWTRRLDTRAESRGGVMAQFSESSEYKRKMANEVTISVLHLLIQQRQVTQAEFDAELARLDQGAMTVAGFAGELLGTSAYLGRFD